MILAGITIFSLIGNGLFDKTNQAKEREEIARELEDARLTDYEEETNKYISGTRNNLPSTTIYPNNGTESEPPLIYLNQRIEIDNPYPGHILYLVVQVCINGFWGDTGFVFSDKNLGGFGVKAIQVLGDEYDKIVIQSGNSGLIAFGYASGHGLITDGSTFQSLPYRLQVICLD